MDEKDVLPSDAENSGLKPQPPKKDDEQAPPPKKPEDEEKEPSRQPS